VVAVISISVFVWSVQSDFLDRADRVFGVVGGLVAVGSSLASAVTLRVASQRVVRANPAVLRNRAMKDLAGWVQVQWRHEAAARLLNQPDPLRVRWSPTPRPVAAGPGEVLGGARPVGRMLRWKLHGDASEVAEKFLQLPQRQLVVLGRPGAEKSALLLLLTLGLLDRRRPGNPVPVLLNLSSWQPNREHLDAWLARRLLEQYPALASRERYGADSALRLVSTDAVLPVLDGLDELPATHHAAAITALTDVMAGDRALVVACRPEEYQAAVTATGMTLGRAAVVELQPRRRRHHHRLPAWRPAHR
jgi:hypothetical protein